MIDLLFDCRFYAYEDCSGMLVTDQQMIWKRAKGRKARLVFKSLLFLPFYLISNKLYYFKLLSGMHFVTLFIFLRKSAVLVTLH